MAFDQTIAKTVREDRFVNISVGEVIAKTVGEERFVNINDDADDAKTAGDHRFADISVNDSTEYMHRMSGQHDL